MRSLIAGVVVAALTLGACTTERTAPLDAAESPTHDAAPDNRHESRADVLADAPSPADSGAGAAVDPDGVQMLFPSVPGGAAWRLGAQDPNRAAGFEIERSTIATAAIEGNLKFWNLVSFGINYASGGTGLTSRLHIYASGGTQRYTWQDTPGYLANERDLKNQEFTVYVRAHEFSDLARTQLSLKVRGGQHTEKNGDLASCTMMTYAPREAGATRVTRFGKELFHPDYDYVPVTPKRSVWLRDGEWVGLKLVTYAPVGASGRVEYRLYVDVTPSTLAGAPRNQWQLLAEYADVDGTSTGKYTRAATWGGWVTTFRVDGIRNIDFALLSVREIAPP